MGIPKEPIAFSIETRTYKKIKEESLKKFIKDVAADDWEDVPFGSDYAGTFVIKVPSLYEQNEIAKIHAVRLNSRGNVDLAAIDRDARQLEYVFALIEVCGVEKPAWFDKNKMWDDVDSAAAIEVGIVFNENLNTLKKKSKTTSSPTS